RYPPANDDNCDVDQYEGFDKDGWKSYVGYKGSKEYHYKKYDGNGKHYRISVGGSKFYDHPDYSDYCDDDGDSGSSGSVEASAEASASAEGGSDASASASAEASAGASGSNESGDDDSDD
ncbi:hypothetical protein, partial [Nocardioides abyssi]